MNLHAVTYKKRIGKTRAFNAKTEIFKIGNGAAYDRASKLSKDNTVINVKVEELEVQE